MQIHPSIKEQFLALFSPLKAGIFGTISPLIAVAASLTIEQRAVITWWMQTAAIAVSMMVGLITGYCQLAEKRRKNRFAVDHADRMETIDLADDTGKPRLLLLEDKDSDRKDMKLLLESQGFRVYPAETVAQAMQLLKKTIEWSAALIDIRLPDGNGLKVVDKLRAYPDVNVVVMTGEDADVVNEARSRGVEVFTKPLRDLPAVYAALRGKISPTAAGQMKRGIDELGEV